MTNLRTIYVSDGLTLNIDVSVEFNKKAKHSRKGEVCVFAVGEQVFKIEVKRLDVL